MNINRRQSKTRVTEFLLTTLSAVIRSSPVIKVQQEIKPKLIKFVLKVQVGSKMLLSKTERNVMTFAEFSNLEMKYCDEIISTTASGPNHVDNRAILKLIKFNHFTTLVCWKKVQEFIHS